MHHPHKEDITRINVQPDPLDVRIPNQWQTHLDKKVLLERKISTIHVWKIQTDLMIY